MAGWVSTHDWVLEELEKLMLLFLRVLALVSLAPRSQKQKPSVFRCLLCLLSCFLSLWFTLPHGALWGIGSDGHYEAHPRAGTCLVRPQFGLCAFGLVLISCVWISSTWTSLPSPSRDSPIAANTFCWFWLLCSDYRMLSLLCQEGEGKLCSAVSVLCLRAEVTW